MAEWDRHALQVLIANGLWRARILDIGASDMVKGDTIRREFEQHGLRIEPQADRLAQLIADGLRRLSDLAIRGPGGVDLDKDQIEAAIKERG